MQLYKRNRSNPHRINRITNINEQYGIYRETAGYSFKSLPEKLAGVVLTTPKTFSKSTSFKASFSIGNSPKSSK
jgi:hypothetical protein